MFYTGIQTAITSILPNLSREPVWIGLTIRQTTILYCQYFLEDKGLAAVMRGPLVYCAESVDNGAELQRLRVNPEAPISYRFAKDTLGGVGMLETAGERVMDEMSVLYRRYQPETLKALSLRLIPYYCWGNRGENEMLVWLYRK